MPGILGFIDSPGAAPANGLLDRMIDSMQPQAWHRVDRCSDPKGRWGIGIVNLTACGEHPQPARIGGSSSLAFLFGRLHLDDSERLAFLSGSEADRASDSEVLLRMYEQADGRLSRNIRGSFAAVIIDPHRQRILIANDSIGQRPIYYNVRGSRLVFGGSVKAILEDKSIDRSLDHEGLSDLFEYRYVLGKKTLFEQVSLLEPGSRLVYDLASNSVDLQNDPSLDSWFGSPADHRAPKVILDELAESFSEGVQRICDSQCQNTVSLSGGMDSRVVMAAVRPRETRVNSFTVGLPGSVERRLSRRIAQKSGCSAIYSETDPAILEPENYVRLCRAAIELTDGMRGSSFHPLTAHLADKFREYDLKLVMTGHGGEFAKLDRAYGFSLDVGTDLGPGALPAKEIVFDKMSDHAWDMIDRRRLFKGELGALKEESPRASFDREFEKIDPSLPIDQQLSYFFLREFFRKHAVLSNRIHGNYSEIEYPFIAEDFVKGVLRAPLELRLNHGIHRHIIEVHNPSLLRIPISDTRVKLDAGGLNRLLFQRPYEILYRLGFFHADVPEHFIPKRTSPTIFADRLLSPRSLDRGDLDSAYLGEIINRFRGGETRLFDALNQLLTFDTFQELFFESG